MAKSEISDMRDGQLRVSQIDVEVSKRIAAMAAARREGRSADHIRREVERLTNERRALVYG